MLVNKKHTDILNSNNVTDYLILFILNFSSVPFEERILAVLKWLQLPKDERYVDD